MLKSDFSNYTGRYGRGTYLVRELLALAEHGQMNPGSRGELLALFNADVARVQAALATPEVPAEGE